MKVEKTFDDFFRSLGLAITICTLIVFFGKIITDYYFFYIIFYLTATVLLLTFLSWYRHRGKVKILRNKRIREGSGLTTKEQISKEDHDVNQILGMIEQKKIEKEQMNRASYSSFDSEGSPKVSDGVIRSKRRSRRKIPIMPSCWSTDRVYLELIKEIC